MDLWSLLERARRLWPDEVAAVDAAAGPGAETGSGGASEDVRRLTWREVGRRVDRLAASLRARGIGPGDRVAALLDNRLELLEAYFAVAGLGAILCPWNVRLHPAELARVLADCGPRWLLTEHAYAALVAELVEACGAEGHTFEGSSWVDATPVVGTLATWPWNDTADRGDGTEGSCGDDFEPAPVGGDDVAQLYYTSGTTGDPKGVMLTHANVWTHALAACAELGLTDRDTWAHVAPMFHLADAWATFAVTWVGGRHVFLRRFEAEAALDLLARERVTLTNLIPTMLARMTHHPRATSSSALDFGALRMILSGGAPIAPSLVRELVAVFRCTYVQTYGMTETSPYLTFSLLKRRQLELPEDARLAWAAKTGRPMIGVELRVVDADGAPVPADERSVGEIQVRGPTVTSGYWGRPEATAEAFVDGWLRTRDLAVLDPEGFVTIVDRAKDVILTGGETVYGTEVEKVILEHPGVAETAVLGLSDPDWGEIVTAVVVPRGASELDPEALQAFCRDRLTGFKVPRRVVLAPELPRTGSGKVSKRALRARLEAAEVRTRRTGQ